MKVIDILKQKHTVIMTMDGITEHQGMTDYTQADLSLNDILFGLGKKFEKTIDLLRKEHYHSEMYNYIKEHCLPVWFVGGTFPMNQTEDDNIVSYTNLLCVDIDNQDIDRQKIFDLPYVFAVLRSAGGVGYYALILVENGLYTKEYYSYLAKLFKSKFNITVDPQCKNIGRKRVLSYEEDIVKWIKPIDYDVKVWKLKDVETDVLELSLKQRMIDYKPKQTLFDNLDFTRNAIWKLLDNGYSIDDINTFEYKYNVWYHIGCEFRHFEDGYEMFEKFSTNTSKYNDKMSTIKKKWDQTEPEGDIEDVCRKWCGICKNKFGKYWYK